MSLCADLSLLIRQCALTAPFPDLVTIVIKCFKSILSLMGTKKHSEISQYLGQIFFEATVCIIVSQAFSNEEQNYVMFAAVCVMRVQHLQTIFVCCLLRNTVLTRVFEVNVSRCVKDGCHLLHKLAELSAAWVSITHVLCWSHNGAETFPICVLCRAVDLPALLRARVQCLDGGMRKEK